MSNQRYDLRGVSASKDDVHNIGATALLVKTTKNLLWEPL